LLYSLIKNEHDTKIGTIQCASINTPTMMLPMSAPILPNVEPIDTAIPLGITKKKSSEILLRFNNVHSRPVYLYSVGNISTAMQYMRLMPTLERASNTDDRTRFSTEDVMKYKHAADKPDPIKLTTILRHIRTDKKKKNICLSKLYVNIRKITKYVRPFIFDYICSLSFKSF